MATAFRAARLLPNSAAEVIEDGVVVVRDGKISNVGPWTDVKQGLEKDVTLRDLGNVTLMPGLFDCHVSDTLSHADASNTQDLPRFTFKWTLQPPTPRPK